MARLFVLFCVCAALVFPQRSAVAALQVSAPAARGAAARLPLHRKRCLPYPAGSGLLADGDFSRGVNPLEGVEFSSGYSFAPDWIVIKGNVDFQGTGDGWANAPGGICSVDLDGNTAGGFETRRFPTAASSTYTVTFLFSGNGGSAPTVKQMDVFVAGQSERLTWDTSGGNDAENGDWLTETLTFAGTGKSTRLRFVSGDPPGSLSGPDVAAISITQKN
jgi:uncharacterized protein DUF642